MSIRVHTERNWQADSTRLWVLRGRGVELQRLELEHDPAAGSLMTWHTVDELAGQAATPPTLELPEDVVEALAAAAADIAPPSSAMAAHLGDAVAVRDRLLELVERTFPPPATAIRGPNATEPGTGGPVSLA